MSVQTLHDTGSDYPITPKMDGGVYGTGIADAICGGVGDEFTLQYTNDSLTVQFNAGSQCIIGGAFFRVMSLTAVTLTANRTIYLCANINLSRANGSRGAFVQRTASNMQSQNLNGSGTQRDLLLYVITTGANGVTGVTDRRIIRTDGVIPSVPSHTHGNITNGGDITSNVAIANGDRLIINDESASKIANSSITFGTSATQFLANNGTWQGIPSHSHGNITNGGDITTNVAIANGDRLVINDESASKISNSSITFGTSTSSFLANNGTWQTPPNTYIRGINLNNVLATITTAASWTATQDCFIRTWNQGKYGNGYIAGVHIASGVNDSHEGFILVKQGTVIAKASEGAWTAYGVQY